MPKPGSPIYEIRRDIDIGPRTLKRGQKVPLSEIERLAPGKVGPLRRTGIIRPADSSDRDEIAWGRSEHKGRRASANQAGLAQMRGVQNES